MNDVSAHCEGRNSMSCRPPFKFGHLEASVPLGTKVLGWIERERKS